jgi:hypothetical protein
MNTAVSERRHTEGGKKRQRKEARSRMSCGKTETGVNVKAWLLYDSHKVETS